ncbi:MAG: Uma2 family endonuclease [Cyanobacteria bacterium K_Offshore_surface_m2_239]|nr:Uma2 family endonuclease [Cyanobacteria bacterium K_Offshore_surface_m2_239]
MALAPPPATAQPSELEPAPLRLPADLRLTPEQFERVCQANPEAVLELTAEGQLIVMTPTGGETGARSLRLGQRLLAWADGPGAGSWIAFDSSTGFQLADGSVLSPDLSLLRRDRWQALSPEQRRGFPPLCPELVIELASVRDASPSDTGPRGVTALRHKMARYQANGARLGWLLLPEERAVEIWRTGQPGVAERLENASRLDGSELAEGLALELEELWAV